MPVFGFAQKPDKFGAGSCRFGTAPLKGGGGVLPLAFPAQGAGYDFDWTWLVDPADPYRTVPPNTGAQLKDSNVEPLMYRNMITQVSHFIENAD